MQHTARFGSGGLSRVALIGIAIFLVVAIAAAIGFDKQSVAVVLVAAAVVPILAYVALNRPILFPFALYPISVVFDPLLKSAISIGGLYSKSVGILIIATFLFHAYRMRRFNVPPASWFFWAAYMLWAFAGWAWTPYPDDASFMIQTVGSLFALYTAAAVYPISPRDYALARRALIVGGVATGLYGLYAFQTGQRFGPRLAPQYNGVQLDPNHYAAFFCIPIGVLAAQVLCSKDTRGRLIAALMIVPMFANVLLTGSRGGLIGCSLMLLYLGIRARAYRALGVMAVAAAGVALSIPNVLARFTSSQTDDASGRGDIWNVGIQAMKSTGLFGSGLGTFWDTYDDNLMLGTQRIFAGVHRPAHSIVVQTIVELGVPGMIFMIAAWYKTARQNAWIPRTSSYFPDSVGYEGAMIGIFVCALTIDLVWFKYPWLLFMMILMLANAAKADLHARRVPLVRQRRRVETPRAGTPATIS